MTQKNDFKRWPNLEFFGTKAEFEAAMKERGYELVFSSHHPDLSELLCRLPRNNVMDEIARAKEMAERDGYGR